MNQSPEQIIVEMEAQVRRLTSAGASERSRRVPRRVWLFVPGVLIAAALPFLILVRGSVYLTVTQGAGPWTSLAVSAIATASFITLLVSLMVRRISGHLHADLVLKWVAAPLVCGYCLYALLYVAETNTKSEEVRAYYRTLHPVLRVTVTTLILADEDVVLTDIGREPADYDAMGLPEPVVSRHYVQSDGYVHAIDLRTRGRPQWLNVLTKACFDFAGFRTQRHVGTADHLHVALPAGS